MSNLFLYCMKDLYDVQGVQVDPNVATRKIVPSRTRYYRWNDIVLTTVVKNDVIAIYINCRDKQLADYPNMMSNYWYTYQLIWNLTNYLKNWFYNYQFHINWVQRPCMEGKGHETNLTQSQDAIEAKSNHVQFPGSRLLKYCRNIKNKK